MSHFDNNSRFLQPTRYDHLVAAHQKAIKNHDTYTTVERPQFLRQAYLIEMQLAWFSTTNGIPLDAVAWYQKEVNTGNLPYGIRLCSTYVSSRSAGAEELGEVLTPMFFQVRSSRKDSAPGNQVEIKVTLDFHEGGSDYKLVAYRDSATLYRGTDMIERWSRYFDSNNPTAQSTWVCEVSERIQKRKIANGLFSLSGTSFYSQVSRILSEYFENVGQEQKQTYVALAKTLSRAIASINKSHSTTAIAPALKLITQASISQAEMSQRGVRPTPQEIHALAVCLITMVRQINPEDPRVMELPQVK